jgi:polyhydroxybutyrate depolymerase
LPSGRRSLALAFLAAACGRGLPDPAPEERAALVAAAAVAPEPSAGCRSGTRTRIRGERRTLVVAGEQRSYLVDAPSAPADRPLPLVLAFHGFRGDASGFRWWAGWGTRARAEGFIAVHPEGHDGVRLLGTTGRGWDLRPDETRDAGFVRALLDTLEEEHCVDRRRVFATGFSNGGFFASLLGCVLADRLAAVASVSGAMDLRACTPARPIPVLLIQGRKDRIVSVELVRGARDWWARAERCGRAEARAGCERFDGCMADVMYCEGPQAHRWPGDATRRIWSFFRTHPAPRA